jgi:hypothetical protein
MHGDISITLAEEQPEDPDHPSAHGMCQPLLAAAQYWNAATTKSLV